jgi:arginyl-tRNA---protein transferase
MRYKGSFSPTCILGMADVAHVSNSPANSLPDPESLEWDPFDSTIRKALDTNAYYSSSAHAKHAQSIPNLEDRVTATTNGHHPRSTTVEPKSEGKIDYTSLDIDSPDNSDNDDTEIPEGSLFDYAVPGILTKTQVLSDLDLDHWKLKVRNIFVDMEDLTGWEKGRVDEPMSIKGIVAELAAALGPEVVKGGSAVDIF